MAKKMGGGVNVKVLLDYKQYCRLKEEKKKKEEEEEEEKDGEEKEVGGGGGDGANPAAFPILEESKSAAVATERHLNHPGEPMEADVSVPPPNSYPLVTTPTSKETDLLGLVTKKNLPKARELLKALDIEHKEEDSFELDGVQFTREQLRWIFHNIFSPRHSAAKKVIHQDDFLTSVKTRQLDHLFPRRRRNSSPPLQWWKV